MLVYRWIFRIDYLCYQILDQLGKYSQLIDDIAIRNAGTDKRNLNVDSQNHIISLSSESSKSIYKINLSVNSFNGVIDYQDGISLDKISSEPVVKIVDQILEKMEFGNKTSFSRIGFRGFTLLDDEKFTFESIKELLLKKNQSLSNVLVDNFSAPNDIAVTFESSDDNDFLRVQFGPYQKAERERYFFYPLSLAEALICDIDLYQKNLVIPDFKLSTFIKHQSKLMDSIATGIKQQIREELS
ncbi:MAG: hypothetical protein HQM12_10480 [SAR324 cluster bacterium]|nr:hypothetical protein [SAR324 cluster bacterium]